MLRAFRYRVAIHATPSKESRGHSLEATVKQRPREFPRQILTWVMRSALRFCCVHLYWANIENEVSLNPFDRDLLRRFWVFKLIRPKMKKTKQKGNEPKYVHVQAHIENKKGHFVLKCEELCSDNLFYGRFHVFAFELELA